MKLENEITVLVTTNYESLKKKLFEYGFELKEEYAVNDIYMIDKNINSQGLSPLEILPKCVIVRDIVNYKKILLYKYKKYAENGDIIEQGKVECPISDIDKAVNFMNSINYKELFRIYDTCIVFANSETELVVQLVNNDYIFIELESNCEFINKKYDNVNQLIDEINKYDLPIDKSNYFVKKAQLMLEREKL